MDLIDNGLLIICFLQIYPFRLNFSLCRTISLNANSIQK